MLKRVVLVMLVAALLVPVGLAGVWLWGQVTSPAAAQTTAETAAVHDPAQTITVVGQGSVSITPDIARVSMVSKRRRKPSARPWQRTPHKWKRSWPR